MGLRVNNDEADLMLLSIDENGDNQISLNEFLDLVYTHNDGLTTIDVSKMQNQDNKQAIVDQIRLNATKTLKVRPMNQWKLFLQKNLNNIAMDLLTVDSDRSNSVEYKDFMKVIERRSKVPEYLKQENGDLLHEIIGQFTDAGRVNYRGLIEELRHFNYEDANAHHQDDSEAMQGSKSFYSEQPKTLKTIF